MIITVSRQYMAGGSEIARLTAEGLGWSLVDNELVDQVAARAGLTRDEVADREEKAPGFVERLTRALATSTPEFVVPEGAALPDLTEGDLVKVTERVVEEIAAAGRVVLVGRAAPAVLASKREALHVRIVAPWEPRIERAMAQRGIGRKEAEKLVDQMDANRTRYHKQHYNREWADPVNYHMTLNAHALGFEGAAEVLMARARGVWGSNFSKSP